MNNRDTSTCHVNVLISTEYATIIKPLFKEALNKLDECQELSKNDIELKAWLMSFKYAIHKFLSLTVKDTDDNFFFWVKVKFITEYLESSEDISSSVITYKNYMSELEKKLSRFVEEVKQGNDEAAIKRTTIDYTVPLLKISDGFSSIAESLKTLAVHVKQLSLEQKMIDPSKLENTSKNTESTISGLFGNRK